MVKAFEDMLHNHYLCKDGVYEVISTKCMDNSEARFQAILYKKSGEVTEVSMPYLCHLGDEKIYIREGDEQSKPKCAGQARGSVEYTTVHMKKEDLVDPVPIRGEDNHPPHAPHLEKKDGNPPHLPKKF